MLLMHHVHRHMPISAVAQVRWVLRPRAPRPRWKALLRPRELVRERAHRFYRERLFRKLRQQIEAEVGGARPLPEGVEHLELESWRINSAESCARIAGLKADILVVTSAPILKPAFFTLPRLGTLNIHYGIAPRYRGEHTLFWPLRLGDYDNIGVTVHHIDQGVDTGRVLARGYLPLSPADTEARLWAKSVNLAAELVAEILKEAELRGRLPEGRAQEAAGDRRAIRANDRLPRHDLRYWISRHVQGRLPPERERRIERFY